jgi:peptidoglycan/LPS O-acetylase OafA/YrhL
VYGLLVQDAFSVGIPNRAFWSIAIEAQLYVLLPLLLLLVRRVSARAMVGLVAAIVVTIGLLGPHVPLMNSALVKFTPDLAVLFAVGLLAAGVVTAGEPTRSRPWGGYALAAAVRCRPGCGNCGEQGRAPWPGAGWVLAGRAAHEVKLVGDVDQLTRG